MDPAIIVAKMPNLLEIGTGSPAGIGGIIASIAPCP
jgi:hypothetical protein